MLQINHLTAAIGEKVILNDFSYTFEKGKIYAIMGPNGSGKSTLANSIMGHPAYKYQNPISKSQKPPVASDDGIKASHSEAQRLRSSVSLQNEKGIYEDLTELEVDERARKGIFLSFQTPLALAGVRVFQLLQMALQGTKDPLKIRQEAVAYAKELGMDEELLGRSMNEGASGGERKKMEVLQAAVLDKKVQIFDEVDTGVDVDSLKAIAHFLKKHQKDKTYIIITHYNRILQYLKPDQVIILKDGKIAKTGDHALAQEIESGGYTIINS